MVYDIAIIGAGVVGTQIARNFSKYDLKTVLLEKESDVAMGTTKANSGIVHAGFDCETGTRMAELNVKGCRMMEELATTLHVPYEKNGSLVVAFSEEEMETIKELYDRGITNGLTEDELQIIDREKLMELEPHIADNAVGALYAPTAGIVSPYELAIGAAECAVGNGVEFLRTFNVGGIIFEDGMFTIGAKDGRVIRSKWVINAGGLFANIIADNFNNEKFSKMGKGILVAPTTHHNVFVGPTSLDMEDYMDGRHDVGVRVGALRETYASAQKSIPSVSARDQITSFAGLRAHWVEHDFYINPAKNNDHFINLIGIESPGLAASPAIAEYVENMVLDIMGEKPAEKADWNPSRKAPVFFRTMSPEERAELIAKDPAYSRIVCRCETVTEGEIRDAIRAPAGAVDLDGVKRRTRAGMGRCQGGFCGSRVMEILSEELDKPIAEIKKFGRGSDIIYERTK